MQPNWQKGGNLLIVFATVLVCALAAPQCLEEKETCTSPECIHFASMFLKNMNPAVDPCDDFYEFACGGFVNSTRIPEDKKTVSYLSLARDEVKQQLKDLLEESSKESDPRPFRMARDLYQACINTSAIEAAGTGPILEKLNDVGGWPVLHGESWKSEGFSWVDAIHIYWNIGFRGQYMFQCRVVAVIKDEEEIMHALKLTPPNLGLDNKYLIKGRKNKKVKAYLAHMVDVAELLGANKSYAKQEMRNVLDFELKLAQISTGNSTGFNDKFTIKELQEELPSISWKDYLNKILAPHVTVDDDEPVLVFRLNYLKQLDVLLKTAPARVISNYITWRVLKDLVKFLPKSFQEGKKHGVIKRKIHCTDYVSKNLDIAVGSMYVRKHFDGSSKNKILHMVNNIRSEFVDMLRESTWMDEETKKAALDKARNMVHQIGYPQEFLDDNKISEYYKDLEITHSGNFLFGGLNVTKFETPYKYKQLRQPVKSNEWSTHINPAEDNFHYFPPENCIKLPAGLVQGVYFSPNRPHYMNYGSIGVVIGHEIAHGFDSKGSKRDKDCKPINWWTEETKIHYLEKTQCIIDQYSNYTVKEIDLNVNENKTLDENISDNLGFKVAYRTYLRWVERNGDEPGLPGLKYSSKQLFWISAVNAWCSVNRPAYLRLQIKDVHSPNRFRVLGPLSNSLQFSSDFSCPLGSKMNPINKCSVW